MRRRGLRVFLLVAVIVGLSAAALSFKEVHISFLGAELDTEGTGPLGVTLDVELAGGSHLVYQADLPGEATVTFSEPVDEGDLRDLLDQFGQPDATIAKKTFALSGLTLAERSLEELEASFGAFGSIESLDTGDGLEPGSVRVVFQATPDISEVRETLEAAGIQEPDIEGRDTQYFLHGVEVSGDAIQRVSLALRALPYFVTVTVTGDAGTSGLMVATFSQPPGEITLSALLDELGHTGAEILVEGEGRFVASGLDLEVAALDALLQALGGVAPTESVDTEGASEGLVLVTFTTPLEQQDLRSVLGRNGYASADVVAPPQETYTVRELRMEEAEVDGLRDALASGLAPIPEGGFTAPTISDPDEDDMDQVINIIKRRVNALGTAQPFIQKLGNNRVLVQLPGVGGTTLTLDFAGTPTEADMSAILSSLGRTGDTVQLDLAAAAGPTYVVTSLKPLTQQELQQLEAVFAAVGAPLAGLDVRDEDDTVVGLSFPEPPNRTILGALVEDLGHQDFSIEDAGNGRFIIRTEDVLTTEQRLTLEGLLFDMGSAARNVEVTGGVEEAKQLIRSTALLEVKQRQCLVTLDELIANPLVCEPLGTDPSAQEYLRNQGIVGGQGRFVDIDIGLTGRELSRAFPGRDSITNRHLVNIHFNSTGADIFSALTRRIAGDDLFRIGIFLDGELLTAPTVVTPILDGRGQITGGFTRDSAKNLSIQLESGRLPVPLTLIRESTVDALLGADSLRKSLIAAMVGLGLVILFIVAYYRMAGVVAAVSLTIYATIVLAILKLIPVAMNLAGVAGIVLSIGMAVDANILIFERMKEEMRTGRSLASSMEVGFRRAWVAIRDSNVSTLITCAILFLFGSRLGGGTPVVTVFAVTLFIGVLVSMFTAITVSRNLLQIVALTPMGKRLTLFTPEPPRRPLPVSGGRE